MFRPNDANEQGDFLLCSSSATLSMVVDGKVLPYREGVQPKLGGDIVERE